MLSSNRTTAANVDMFQTTFLPTTATWRPPVAMAVLNDPVAVVSGLLSSDAAAASRERLAALKALREHRDLPADAGPLEAVVREMLRPMLKDWLDEHLPEIVEELVTREIARITRRS